MVTRPNGFTDANSQVGNGHANHRVSYLGGMVVSTKESYVNINSRFALVTAISILGAADQTDAIVDRYSFPTPRTW